jgi:hypothetical protein
MMKRTIAMMMVVGMLSLTTMSVRADNSVDSAPRIKVKNGTSTNWSGYAIETNLVNPASNAVGDVKGTWTVPTLICTSLNTYSSAWVGIDGYSDNTVEQTGTEHDCVNGQPQFSAWYEMYPKMSKRVNLTIRAGDTISAEVKYTTKNQFQLTLMNQTTGQLFVTVQKANAQRQSAEWVMEAPWSGGVLPLTNFGTITFTNSQATINGHTGTVSDAAWQKDSINMVTSSGGAKATTSALSADGSSFSVTWNAN